MSAFIQNFSGRVTLFVSPFPLRLNAATAANPSYVMGETDTADCPAGGAPVESSVAWFGAVVWKLWCLCSSNGGI